MKLASQAVSKAMYVYLIVLLFVAGITSFVLIPAVPATVPSYLLIYGFAPFVIWYGIQQNNGFIKEGLWIAGVFVALNLLAQLNNYATGVRLIPSLILVEGSDPGKVLLRNTLLTQSLYLFAGILFYLYLKYFAVEQHVRYLFAGMRLLVLYGLLELVLFLVTGKNSDYISNRVFHNNGLSSPGSVFAVMNIAGLDILRVKSLTGEPSMFALAVIPFWIIAGGLNRRNDWLLFGLALVLSFSTSAFLGLFVGIAGWIAGNAAVRKKAYWLLSLLLVAGTIFYYANGSFHALWNEVVVDKLSAQNGSGAERSSFFFQHLNYWWNNLGWSGKLLGIGFGYVRSADFLSTILVNNGIAGLALFTWFFFKPVRYRFANKELHYAYITALVATYLILMVSVPEFAYLSIWILIAFPYFCSRKTVSQVAGSPDARLNYNRSRVVVLPVKTASAGKERM